MKFISFHNGSHTLNVNKTDTVNLIIKKLAKKIRVSFKEILLIFQNRIISENELIGKYEIGEDESVWFDCRREYREFRRKNFTRDDKYGRPIAVNVQERSELSGVTNFVVATRIHTKIRDFRDILNPKLSDNVIYDLHNGNEYLHNDFTLSDYSIGDGDTIEIRYCSMRVFVECNERCYAISTRPNETIAELKKKLSQKCQLDACNIFLRYTALMLLDRKTLADYHVENNSLIYMTKKPICKEIEFIHSDTDCESIYIDRYNSDFAATINTVAKHNYALSMQIELFFDRNRTRKINASDWNDSRKFIAQIFYKIAPQPPFFISFIDFNYEEIKIDCCGDTTSIISTLSKKISNSSSEAFEIPFQYFADKDKSNQIDNIDDFIRNCSQDTIIYYAFKPIVDNYTPIQLLGKGSFGKVYKCIEARSNKTLVLKQFDLLYERNVESFRNELSIMKSLGNHPRIIKFERQIETNDALYVLMEYMPGGSVGSYVRSYGALPQHQIVKYAKQILEGLQHLHNKNIIHGDIKGDNILIGGGDIVKLCDFGLSKILLKIASSDSLNGTMKSLQGTANWMAPEIILGEPYGYAVDIWSFGATMVEILTGSIPFHDCDHAFQVIYKIGSTKRIDFNCSKSSEAIKLFIDLCLQEDPNKRATTDDLLNHPFLINEF